MKSIVILSVFFACFGFFLHETETAEVLCDDEITAKPNVKTSNKEQNFEIEPKSHRNTFQRTALHFEATETPAANIKTKKNTQNEEPKVEKNSKESGQKITGRSYLSETVIPGKQQRVRRPKILVSPPKQKIQISDEISSSETKIIPIKTRSSRPASNKRFKNKKSIRQRPKYASENIVNEPPKSVSSTKRRPKKGNENYFYSNNSPKSPSRSKKRQRPSSKLSIYNSYGQPKLHSSEENQIFSSDPRKIKTKPKRRPTTKKPVLKYPKRPSAFLSGEGYNEYYPSSSFNKQKINRNLPPKHRKPKKSMKKSRVGINLPPKPFFEEYEYNFTPEDYAASDEQYHSSEFETDIMKNAITKALQKKLLKKKQKLLKKLPFDYYAYTDEQSPSQFIEYSEEMDEPSISTEYDTFSSDEDYLGLEYENDFSSEYDDDNSIEEDSIDYGYNYYNNIPSGNMKYQKNLNLQSYEIMDDYNYDDFDYDEEMSESEEASSNSENKLYTTRSNIQTNDLDEVISKEPLINIVRFILDCLWSMFISTSGKIPLLGELIIDMVKTGLTSCKIIP